jgi:hypothetical protein
VDGSCGKRANAFLQTKFLVRMVVWVRQASSSKLALPAARARRAEACQGWLEARGQRKSVIAAMRLPRRINDHAGPTVADAVRLPCEVDGSYAFKNEWVLRD